MPTKLKVEFTETIYRRKYLCGLFLFLYISIATVAICFNIKKNYILFCSTQNFLKALKISKIAQNLCEHPIKISLSFLVILAIIAVSVVFQKIITVNQNHQFLQLN